MGYIKFYDEFDQFVSNINEKILLCTICSYNMNGKPCTESQKTLGNRIFRSETIARKNLQELERKGLITIEKSGRYGVGQSGCKYWVTPKVLNSICSYKQTLKTSVCFSNQTQDLKVDKQKKVKKQTAETNVYKKEYKNTNNRIFSESFSLGSAYEDLRKLYGHHLDKGRESEKYIATYTKELNTSEQIVWVNNILMAIQRYQETCPDESRMPFVEFISGEYRNYLDGCC